MTPDAEARVIALIDAVTPSAAAALASARADDRDEVSTAIRVIGRQWGRPGIIAAMLGWADALAAANPAAGTVGPAWWYAGRDAPEADADDVDPVARWCGQFAYARARLDSDTVAAMIAALPWDDRKRIGRYPFTLVLSVAATLRAIGDGTYENGGNPRG